MIELGRGGSADFQVYCIAVYQLLSWFAHNLESFVVYYDDLESAPFQQRTAGVGHFGL